MRIKSSAFVAAVAALLSGCTEMGALMTCSVIGAVANQRSFTFDGRVNGQRYRDTITWQADRNDPRYVDPADCTVALAQKWRSNDQSAFANTPDVQLPASISFIPIGGACKFDGQCKGENAFCSAGKCVDADAK